MLTSHLPTGQTPEQIEGGIQAAREGARFHDGLADDASASGMSEERLRGIEGRLAAATPAPWGFNSYNRIESGATVKTVCWVPVRAGDTATVQGAADAAFIAAAPTDLRDLLREVRRLRGE